MRFLRRPNSNYRITLASQRCTSLPSYVRAVRNHEARKLEEKFAKRRAWMRERGIGINGPKGAA